MSRAYPPGPELSRADAPQKNQDGSRAAAFFDLDRTLMAGSSGIFFARAAYEAGMISRRRLLGDLYQNLRFRLHGSTDDWADAVRRRVGEMLAGVAVRDLQRMSPRVLAGVLPRLYPQMLARAYSHQDAGRPVYIVTAASQEMADLLAHVLVFDGGIGSRLEVRDGHYTGRADGPFNYREGKVLSLRELAARERIDLAASYAYSDSESDLPMLRAVGYPVVVNPDPDLARIAATEDWEVLRLDRLGRRLKIAVALSAGASLAGLGGVVRGRANGRGGGGRIDGDCAGGRAGGRVAR
ncbi:MAG TPA: HAD-IB family hydrolase, partial [Solirubrobacteraceae bacterium]|nr:HAD-IB family hydrolase [Solirubrobacteraceae bacterium]